MGSTAFVDLLNDVLMGVLFILTKDQTRPKWYSSRDLENKFQYGHLMKYHVAINKNSILEFPCGTEG